MTCRLGPNNLLGVIIRAYREFEGRVGAISQPRGAKSEMVRAAIQRFAGAFAAKELQDRCPGVCLDLIRRILREERRAGRLQVSGRGPEARWRRI